MNTITDAATVDFTAAVETWATDNNATGLPLGEQAMGFMAYVGHENITRQTVTLSVDVDYDETDENIVYNDDDNTTPQSIARQLADFLNDLGVIGGQVTVNITDTI